MNLSRSRDIEETQDKGAELLCRRPSKDWFVEEVWIERTAGFEDAESVVNQFTHGSATMVTCPHLQIVS